MQLPKLRKKAVFLTAVIAVACGVLSYSFAEGTFVAPVQDSRHVQYCREQRDRLLGNCMRYPDGPQKWACERAAHETYDACISGAGKGKRSEAQ